MRECAVLSSMAGKSDYIVLQRMSCTNCSARGQAGFSPLRTKSGRAGAAGIAKPRRTGSPSAGTPLAREATLAITSFDAPKPLPTFSMPIASDPHSTVIDASDDSTRAAVQKSEIELEAAVRRS